MSPILLTGPAVEPLSLDEAKTFLRVEHSDDDQVIGALIASARMHVEAQAKIALLTQNWRMVFDCWPHHGRIVVRPGPLRALSAVRVYDINSNPHIVDTQAFVPDFGVSTLYGVNSGLGRSGKVLRRALKLPDNSSAVTEPVIAAARSIDPRILIVAICDERLHFLQSLKTWSVFGAGWSRRVAEVKSVALAMAADFRLVHG